jgi:hypothetical protein
MRSTLLEYVLAEEKEEEKEKVDRKILLFNYFVILFLLNNIKKMRYNK